MTSKLRELAEQEEESHGFEPGIPKVGAAAWIVQGLEIEGLQ